MALGEYVNMPVIVFTSYTGTTREYARMLSERTGMLCHELGQDEPAPGSEVVYMGWLRAGRVVGLKQAMKKWKVRCVCAVAMAYSTDELLASLRRDNGLAADMPLFILQGGLLWDKLGTYRLPMKLVVGTVARSLEKKTSRSPQDEDLLTLCRQGGSRVCEANLAGVFAWCETI